MNVRARRVSGFRLKPLVRRWCRASLVLLAMAIAAGHLGAMHRFLELFSHFQVQYLFLALALTAALALLRDRAWACLGAACIILTAAMVLPWYWPVAKSPAPHGNSIRLMLFNVLQSNTRYGDVVEHIFEVNPDVIVLQEVHAPWVENVQRLAENWPHRFYAKGGVLRGILVFSRYPLENAMVEPSADSGSPSASMTVVVGDTKLFLLAAQPWPPTSAIEYGLRNRELELIAARMHEAPSPRVLIGDLNVTMWTPYYRRLVRNSGLVDARRGFGIVPTFPMDSYVLLRVPIDHCLVSDDVFVKQLQRGEACGSDHAPLIVDVVLPGR